jgi:hypothetical protein
MSLFTGLLLLMGEHMHNACFSYCAENDVSGLKWKWVAVKQSGARISQRCGMSIAVAPGNKAYAFGGVWDIEMSEEDLAGTFYNDLHILDFDKILWRTGIVLSNN